LGTCLFISDMKCKGTNKDTYGLGCNTEQANRKLGLGISCRCYSNFLMNNPKGKERVKRSTLSATKPRRDLEKAGKEKKERQSLTTLIKSVVNVFHKYVRERDKGKPCIACGTQWHKDFHASHYFKAELYTTLRLNEKNVHGGCVRCNIRLEGNLSEYSVNLPKRIGVKAFKELNELADLDHQIDFKWDRQELIEIRNHYKNKSK